MSVVTLPASPSVGAISPTRSEAASQPIPNALQQLLQKIEELRNVSLRVSDELNCLRSALESKWQTAIAERSTSSTVLNEILEFGWIEWQRVVARVIK